MRTPRLSLTLVHNLDFGSGSSWTFTLKCLFHTVSRIFLLSIVLYSFIYFTRLGIQRHQEDVTNFAISLQQASRRRNQLAESTV